MSDPRPFLDAWRHAMALQKMLRGHPGQRQVEGLVKALEKMRGEQAVTR